MRQSRADSPLQQWRILSTHVRPGDGPRRLEQAIRFLLGPDGSPEGTTPVEGNSDHASGDLCPRLDRPPGARPDD
jgi:hypothetical protein